MMTRKHFRAVAYVIATVNMEREHPASISTLYSVASGLAREFEVDNDAFDRVRFMQTCGFKKNHAGEWLSIHEHHKDKFDG